jgi:hypothetical protein
MKKILTLVSLVLCFAATATANAAEAERFENGQLESFGCCGLPTSK